MKRWLDDILIESQEQSHTEGDIINTFYVPDLKKKLQNSLSLLPLWSKIENSIQELSKKSPFTSASCEKYFSYLKQNEFMTPMRADEAVTTHLASINGTLKIESTSTLFKENDKVSCKKRQKVAEEEETKKKQRLSVA